ncbi:Uncharacterized protein YmaE [Auxenochlorella protothecoides]|uniref:Uncharacterized protein YmaE n=1 Tax=Auxenochlorella protothecoides TaxID=3075 RepID=A0A087S9N6_AUXPR|nr:Uncharacterized protein YmaE [Auxenochlorella protothecoides]KFM22440.1 Uncharacterized protein YmaE [Auxenochlorella protothecoides]RMZ52212.1 hypothetical protein APUTEX25_001602 [Auxenochlorella protothecoides]|eukprot:RMZ52212.1 hypothetical protein APUTEX25_001602 [Auxenochlorella protothecoides]
MSVFICVTCAAQYEGQETPSCCRICDDDRQYVGENGSGIQEWTTAGAVEDSGHRNSITQVREGLHVIGLEPPLGIGQVAHLITRPDGNILWDCLYLSQASVPDIQALGGVSSVVISHPHFYTAAASWAQTFGCKVYVHAADAGWVTQPFPSLRQWTGDRMDLGPGLTVYRLGGHFPGSSVLLWDEQGRAPEGVLFTGDTIMPTPRGATFMYSFPNMLPLPAGEVRRMRGTAEGLRFDQLRGSFAHRVIEENAREVVLRSAALYIGLLDGTEARTYF